VRLGIDIITSFVMIASRLFTKARKSESRLGRWVYRLFARISLDPNEEVGTALRVFGAARPGREPTASEA